VTGVIFPLVPQPSAHTPIAPVVSLVAVIIALVAEPVVLYLNNLFCVVPVTVSFGIGEGTPIWPKAEAHNSAIESSSFLMKVFPFTER
jgi:xanthosine utilization system XapX-like protein